MKYYNLNYLKNTYYVYVCQKMEERKNINKESLDDNEEEEKNDINDDIKKKKKDEEKNNNKFELESSISYIKLEELQKNNKEPSNKDSKNKKNE